VGGGGKRFFSGWGEEGRTLKKGERVKNLKKGQRKRGGTEARTNGIEGDLAIRGKYQKRFGGG